MESSAAGPDEARLLYGRVCYCWPAATEGCRTSGRLMIRPEDVGRFCGLAETDPGPSERLVATSLSLITADPATTFVAILVPSAETVPAAATKVPTVMGTSL